MRTRVAVLVDPFAVDVARQDVDAEHLVAACVPPSALTEHGLAGRAGHCVSRHAETCAIEAADGAGRSLILRPS
jgi:hypothetical protein